MKDGPGNPAGASIEMTPPQPGRPRSSQGGAIGFVVFMLVLTALFATLGEWQMRRLAEKEGLIAAVEARLDAPAIALPPAAEWVGFDPEVYDFRPVILTGRFNHAETIRVFTALSKTNGRFKGTGYWIVAPFLLADGGTVFVNRGFVPEVQGAAFANGGPAGEEAVTITGLARRSESLNAFTPGADRTARIEYARNIDRLIMLAGPGQAPFAPVYVDQKAGAAGALPQGGETVVSFANRHFEYALTWFSLAIVTPLMVIVWGLRQRRARRAD